MVDVFDNWKQLSFGGIVFPFSDITIKGSLRHYLHEFIKRPGGEVETLARKAYVVSVKCEMLDTIIPVNSFARYVDLYPSRLSALVSLCEQGDPQDLFLPMLGKALRVKATDWTRSISANRRSGESVSFEFLEDSTEAFTALNLIGATSASIVPMMAVVQREVEALGDVRAKDFLDKLIDAVNSYLDAVDRVNEVIEYQTARIDTVVTRCAALAAVPSIGLATSATANLSVIRFWALATRIRDQRASASRPILGFVTDRVMSVVDVAIALGNPLKAIEILRFNDLDDAMAIPRNTSLRYLAAA